MNPYPPILSSLLLCPAAALLLVLWTPSRWVSVIRLTALAASSLMLYLSVTLMRSVDFTSASFQLVERYAWVPDWGIYLSLGVNGMSAVMVLLTGIVIFCGVIVSWTITQRVKEFYANMFFLVWGVFGVFMTTNLFFFFLFYEVAVIPMYLLIVLWGSTRKEYAAMKLTLYLLIGSTLIMAVFLALYALPGSGTFELETLKHTLVLSPGFQNICFLAVLLGFGVLAGLFPFHVWSPDGHVAAPTAASMLHAGVLMKLGGYGILRIGVYLFPVGAQTWSGLLAVLALCNILYGALVACRQRDLKFLIGFSSVSHMGLVLLGIATLNPWGVNGAVFQMFSHGIMTALFFACVGHVYDYCHTRMMDELGGLARLAPRISTFFILAGFCGLGLPGLSGFAAEFLIILGAIKAYPVIGAASIAGLVITAYYVLTAIQRAFYNQPAAGHNHSSMRDSGLWQYFPRALLVALLVLFGVWPNLFLSWIQASTGALLS